MTDQMIDPARTPPDASLSRRALLRAAAGLVGALALGLDAAVAQAAGRKADAPLALAFWDGTRLTDAARITGDASLGGRAVRVIVHSRPGDGPRALHALTAHFFVPAGKSAEGETGQWLPFTAWAASAHDGGRGIGFRLPVHPAEGARLAVEHGAGRTDALRLGLAGAGPGLRVGTYLVTPAGTNWQGGILTDGADGIRLTMPGVQPARFDHLLLSVCPE